MQYKFEITNTNSNSGWSDVFEVFLSYKDNIEYIVSANSKNFYLDLYELKTNKKINHFKGHENDISTIRYFLNKKNNYKEYLISGDYNRFVIIWDISSDYKKIQTIKTQYLSYIYSCLLIFPYNSNNDFIVTSSNDESNISINSATIIYSLNTGKYIKHFNNSINNAIFYLLSWFNIKNNNYYIIEIARYKIFINNLLKEELYCELHHEPEDTHLSGFIYYKDKNNYLCTSSTNGFINIWDLFKKKIFQQIDTNKCYLTHIIEWNQKYIIVADFKTNSFKIVDFEEKKLINGINGPDFSRILSIKKIYHPKYGESLLVSNDKNCIHLFTFQ